MALGVEGIKITDITLHHPRRHKPLSSPQFYIKINCDQKWKAVTAKKRLDKNYVNWEESVFFEAGDITEASIISFTVVKTTLFLTKTVGSSTKKVVELIRDQSGPCIIEFTSSCWLIFRAEKLSRKLLLSTAVDAALRSPTQTLKLTAPVKAKSQKDRWSSFLSQFETFVSIVNTVSEFSPYAKLACCILSAIPKTILSQQDRNEKVERLCEKLINVYDYITDSERLSELTASQSKTLLLLIQQTVECAYFLRAYSTGNTVGKIWNGNSIDETIVAFSEKLDYILNAITCSIILETNIVTLRIANTTTETRDLILLNEMPYARDAGFVFGKQCLPGTRQYLINEILEWANNDTSQRILLLTGQAGIGKSAVAHTIAEIFKRQNRLGSMFCFNRGYKDRGNFLFSTISRGLADTDVQWRESLVTIIQNTAIRTSMDPVTQFDELISKPLKAVTTIGPVIIIIDALDESGDRGERMAILDLLFRKHTELPSDYRFIVTSRPELDIESFLCQNATTAVLVKRMDDIPINETFSDIQSYISSRLHPIASILDSIEGDWSEILTKRAKGLFQWAETACRFINPTVRYLPAIQKRWSTCVSDSLSSLYAFYEQIISSQPECEDPQFIEEFKVVVGILMVAREPFTMNALQNILQDIIPNVQSILGPFGSLFLGVNVNEPLVFIRPLHTSLFDFFNHRDTINNRFFISMADQGLFTIGCLKLMNRMLRFNICDLETSHLRNRDVPDFQARVEKMIHTSLSYACRFWTVHLHSSLHNNHLTAEIRVFMDNNLLVWFEVLSLLNEIEQGCSAMSILRDWSLENDSNSLVSQASDAWHFVHAFKEAISDSTPHLYISALPFTQRDSFVSKKYLPRYPRLFSIEIGQSIRPEAAVAEIGITKSHTSVSSSLAFSPKGEYIASGFLNSEIWLWDYKTGERVNHWNDGLLGDDDVIVGISDIIFSSDGELIYGCFFGRTGVLIWNIKAGDIKREFHELNMDPCRFSTISSHGQFIAFESDKQIFVCDRKNGLITGCFDTSPPKDAFALFKDKKRSAFSPNGNLFAFIGKESKVHVWDNRKRSIVATWGKSCCLALSDNYIAILNEFSGIAEVWSLATRKEISFSNLGIDVSKINLIRFSTNEQYVFSSCDNTYYIWTLLTGELVHQSHVEDTILELALSPDLEYIALATDNLNCTTYIRRWDRHIQPSSDKDYPDAKFVDRFWMHGTYLVIVLEQEFLRIWDITTMNTIVFKIRITLDSPVAIFSVGAATWVAYVTDVVLALNYDDPIVQSRLCVWNEMKGQIILEESRDDVTTLAFSATSNTLFSGYHQGTVKMWDICANRVFGESYTTGGTVKALSFPQTSTKFLVAYEDRISGDSYLEVRECSSPNKISTGPFRFAADNSEKSLKSFDKLCFSAFFSPDGRYIVGTSKYGIELFDAGMGTKVHLPGGSGCSGRRGEKLSSNGKYIAWLSYDEVILWDIESNTALPGFPLNTGHPNTTHAAIYFSNDSTQIMVLTESDTRTQDYTQIVIWDIQSRDLIKMIRYPRRQKSRIQSLAFDNEHLILADGFGGCPKILGLHALAIATSFHDHNVPIDSYRTLTSATDTEIPSVENAETLNYALVAKNNASLSAFANTEGGWVLGPSRELLFWVPPERREGLWYPCTTHMPMRNITKLCFDKFVHGTRWARCGCTASKV